MKKVDIFVKVGFVIALAVIYFFWRCEYDPMVTILALVILLGASALTYFQYKKIQTCCAFYYLIGIIAN